MESTATPSEEQIKLLMGEAMEKIALLYIMLQNKGFEGSLIRVPRTTHPDDQEPVCEIQFTDTGPNLDVDIISLNGESFTPAEMYSFVKRAEGFMIQTLAHYNISKTIH